MDIFKLRRTFGQSSTFFSLKRVKEIDLLKVNVDMVADTDTWIRMANYEPTGNDKIYFSSATWSCVTFHYAQRSADQAKFMAGRAQMYTDFVFDSRMAIQWEEKKRIALVFVLDAFDYLIRRNLPTGRIEEMHKKITGANLSLRKIVKKNVFRLEPFRKLANKKIKEDGTAFYLSFPRGENVKWFEHK